MHRCTSSRATLCCYDRRLPAFLVDEDVVMHELAAAAETVYDEKPQPGRPTGGCPLPLPLLASHCACPRGSTARRTAAVAAARLRMCTAVGCLFVYACLLAFFGHSPSGTDRLAQALRRSRSGTFVYTCALTGAHARLPLQRRSCSSSARSSQPQSPPASSPSSNSSTSWSAPYA
jgi:hypothetical protein